MKLREITTCVKVTALKTTGDDLLVGVGGNVEVYTGGIKTSVIRTFKGATVHGFADVGNGQIVAYGGKHLARLTQESGEWRVKGQCVARLAPDWILDVTTGAKPSDSLLALTAHNNVLALHENTIMRCEEKCILYSGRFVAKDSIVLGGTVFREIVIWRYEGLPTDGDDGDRPVLHRLKGHEGVIFCVDFSEERGLICSASDDRTARIWNVDFGSVDRWRDALITPARQLYASTARVFRCVFTGDGHVVTGGEDSALCVWKIDECGEAAMRWRAHSGSPVWCLHADGQKIISGGGDCGVRSWSLEDSNPVSETLRAGFEEGDYPKVVRMWGERHMLCLSNEGYVLSFDDEAGFNHLYHHDLLRGYGLLEANGEQMFLCTLEGHLFTLKLSTSANGHLRASEANLSKIHDSKIFSLHILNRSTLTCGIDGELRLASDECIRTLSLPPCGEQRWVSCAKLVGGSTLIVGDRCGGLHVYGLGQKQGRDPLQSVRRAHGKRGVGDIWVPEDGRRIRTAGRDGMVKEFALSEGGKLEELSRVRMPIDWLERLIGDTLIAGFHSSYFVIYNFIEERSLVSVPCGGSHRSWDLSHDSSTLVFVKDKLPCRARLPAQHGLEKAVIKSAFHPREVSVVHHFEISARHFLVTAGEDTVIKIHEVDNMGRRTECLSLRSHISCVRSVKTLAMSEDETVMVSAGGRAQLKVWRVNNSFQTTATLRIIECASHMLKGDDKRRKKTWREADVIHDAEVRYMDIDIRPSREKGLLVTAACSDGVLRLLSVSQDLSTVTLLDESCRIGRCFLKLTSTGEHTMVSTSTDGISRLWTLEDCELGFKSAVTTSQSGCNALVSCDGETILTGGDDGSIAVSSFVSAGKCSSFPRLHSSHVTGLSITVDQHVISCSVDQRIAIWKFDSADMSSVELVDQLCTDVADIQAMAVWRADRDEGALIAVGGEGLAIYKCVF